MESQTDHIRLAIFTDTHLGHNINDPVLSGDSFNAFDESLRIAKNARADAVLHSGDLFDTSSPEKLTYTRAIDILRENCLGDDPPTIEIQNTNGALISLNTEDPTLKVSLPFFIIQGNHDQAGGIGLKSPLHILSSANLANLFTIPDDPNHIELNYVLIRRGNVEVYVYGLGFISENKFLQVLKDGGISFNRPDPTSDGVRRFFLLMVHQNRPNRQNGPTAAALLSQICPWMHLVVWGHEHENRVDIEEVSGLKITQPGCPIYTELKKENSGEKDVLIFDIRLSPKDDDFRKVPLESARPFVYRRVSLANLIGKRSKDILAFLKTEVEAAIADASNISYSTTSNYAGNSNPNGQSSEISRPIIHLEVDTAGVDTSDVNYKALDTHFEERVANKEIVRMTRTSRQRNPRSSTNAGAAPGAPVSATKVEDILNEIMAEKSMEFIPKEIVDNSLKSFVDEQQDVFEADIQNLMDRQLAFVKRSAPTATVIEISKAGELLQEEIEKMPSKERAPVHVASLTTTLAGKSGGKSSSALASTKTKGKRTKKTEEASVNERLDESDDDSDGEKPERRQTRGKRGRGRKATQRDSSNESDLEERESPPKRTQRKTQKKSQNPHLDDSDSDSEDDHRRIDTSQASEMLLEEVKPKRKRSAANPIGTSSTSTQAK